MTYKIGDKFKVKSSSMVWPVGGIIQIIGIHPDYPDRLEVDGPRHPTWIGGRSYWFDPDFVGKSYLEICNVCETEDCPTMKEEKRKE